jgi:DNA-directed RNA polymerase specialized sigma24 family protein
MDTDLTKQSGFEDHSSKLPIDDGNRELLANTIEQEWRHLLSGIRVYVRKFDLATDAAAVDATARDILQDTVATALANSNKYDPRRLPLPWLLGIAINHVRHRRRVGRRVVAIVDAQLPGKNAGEDPRPLSTDEMFDRLQHACIDSGANRVTAEELLSLVDEDDRQTLRLAFIEGFRGKFLAARLGISEGAAWARTSRALSRLRRNYFESEEKGKKD